MKRGLQPKLTMEDYPFLLKFFWLVGILMAIVGAGWLSWRICAEALRYLRDRGRPPDSPYKSGWPPSWVVDEYLEKLYMAPEELARRCRCSANLIYDLIGGKAPFEEEMAQDLAWVLPLDAHALLSMEAEYRSRLAKEAEAEDADRQHPVSKE